MTDTELLELAAKAAGIYRGADRIDGAINVDGVSWPMWNPLIDDGDALRLAVKFNLCITTDTKGCSITGISETINEDSQDVYAATRRAIVRAAAEIGK